MVTLATIHIHFLITATAVNIEAEKGGNKKNGTRQAGTEKP